MIRVTRILEYTYTEIDAMVADMKSWNIPAQGIRGVNKSVTIRSAILPPDVSAEAEAAGFAVAVTASAGIA